MRFLRNIPIESKLTIIIMVTSCAALLVACIAFATYEQIAFRTNLINDLLSTAKMIGDNSSAALSFDSPEDAEKTLKSLSVHPHIVAGAIYDKDGKVFASYPTGGARGTFSPPPVEADGHRFGNNYLRLFRRIDLAGENAGTVYLESDLEEMHTRLWRYALIAVGVMFISTLVAFLLSRKLQQIISEPISHLVRITHAVATEKNYSVRAIKQSDDELGRLIDSFNDMLTQIETRDGALDQARQNLETRVEERTSELQAEVAERKQAEESLRAGEARTRLIVDTAFDAIVTTDEGGTIVEWNSQAKKTFGWSRAEALGRNFTETIIPERYHDADEPGMRRSMPIAVTPILQQRIEIMALHKDGHTLPVELAVSPFQTGESLLFSAFLRDITERKAAEAKLEAAHKELLNTSRQAGMAEVATNVLHNVGNVLNSINVSATLVVDNLKKSKVSNLAKVVALLREHQLDLGTFITSDSRGTQLPAYLAQLSERLLADEQDMLRELVALRRNIEHIKVIVTMQQSYAKVSGLKEIINITDLVDDSLRLNAAALHRHGVEVVRKFEEVPALTVDKHKVLQILVNLVRNAKYACDESAHADRRLTVRVTNGDDRVKISVVDNGVGIPAENLVRIFNHGFTTRKDGHGFGLHSGALAAKEMGGSLTAHSDGLGKGATFTLLLPCQPVLNSHE